MSFTAATLSAILYAMEMTHGLTAYANGECRCTECRKAWAEYHRNRRAAKRVTKEQRQAYYLDRATKVTVRVSGLAAGILRNVVQQTGHDDDDVIEQLLRAHGRDVQFVESAA